MPAARVPSAFPMNRRGAQAAPSLLCLVVLLGCGGPPPPPGPGQSLGVVPDLRGARVMVFPLQSAQGFDRLRFDPELTHALTQRGVGIEWVLPDELRRIQDRTPGLDMRVENLPVGVFLQTEVRRIGDPLYGYLRRLGAVANSDLALVPVAGGTGQRPEEEGTASPTAAVDVAATLIETRSGRVLWYGVVEGQGRSPDDPAALATAADALARLMAPYGPSRGA